jgi:hypothetical protein
VEMSRLDSHRQPRLQTLPWRGIWRIIAVK